MAIFNIKRLLGLEKVDNTSTHRDILSELKKIRPNFPFCKEVDYYLLNQADECVFTPGDKRMMYLGKEQIIDLNKKFPTFDGIFILGNYDYSQVASLYINGVKLHQNSAALFEKDNMGYYNFKRVISLEDGIIF